ncbi:MAG: patatin family protein [Erysipelotrichaceae bacterium]|nr:patatin family protein [Erysipelotrichaceae bacterium]MCI9524794.1 patatin family protein [Erysipelotrichaceae bacterium]
MKLGMVLEGGGMRGVYTAGVLDFFIDKDFYPDGIVGVSAGACHATSYIAKQRGRNFRVNTKYLSTDEYLSLKSLVKTGSLFGMDFIFHKIPEELDPFDYDAYNRANIEYIAVSTDIESGEPYYHVINDAKADIDYIMASSSLPLLSKVVKKHGRKLMDGGVGDSIPITFMQKRGYDKNIVVLTQCGSYRKGKNNLMPIIRHNYKAYPKFVEALDNRHIRYNQTLDELKQMEKDGSVFVIRPSKPVTISRIEKNIDKLRALYEEGYQDAKTQWDDLQKFLHHAE